LRFNEHFKGQGIPFGCGVWFLPAPTIYKNPKAHPSRSYGIFLGYRLHPGGRWNGEYLVADLDSFVNANLEVGAKGNELRIHPHVTERVNLGKRGVCFPVKPAYDRANETLSGREDALKIRLEKDEWTPNDEFGVPRKCMFSTADSMVVKRAEGTDPDNPGSPDQVVKTEPVGNVSVKEEIDEPGARASTSSHMGAVDEIAPGPTKHWFVDAIGRRFPADKDGQKIYKSKRPSHISQSDWKSLSQVARNAICDENAKHEAEKTEGAVAAAAIVNKDAEDLWTYIGNAIDKVEKSIEHIATANFLIKKFRISAEPPTILKSGLGQSLLFEVLLTCI